MGSLENVFRFRMAIPVDARSNNRPKVRDKTVLLGDDICTQSHSLESARAFTKAAGANVICFC